MIKPTIGRVVWYRDSALSDQFMSAQIAYVHSDWVVNLCVLDPTGEAFSAIDITLWQGDPDDCPESCCCWMPYQKGQAAKAEALEKQVNENHSTPVVTGRHEEERE